MQRRSFLSIAAGVAAAGSGRLQGASDKAEGFIDTNVWLSEWPTRHSWAKSPRDLTDKLRHHGVTSAWVGSFESALHSDIGGLNARLVDACSREGSGMLIPFGAVNPTLPDWQEDVRRCHEVHRMPGVRLMPTYHGYTLDDERFVKCIELAERRDLLVQVVVSMEDDRSQNPLFMAGPAPLLPLIEVLQKFSSARVMLLNGASRALIGNAALLKRFTGVADLYIETAVLEGVAGIEKLLETAPRAKLTFGSFAPFYYFEAALLKLQESDLTAGQLAAIKHGNASAALAAIRVKSNP